MTPRTLPRSTPRARALALLPLLLAGCTASITLETGQLDTVSALERARFAALQANDLARLETMLAPDLRYCHSTGVCESRAQFLDALRSGTMRYRRIDVLALEPRAEGKVVMIHGRLALEAEMRGTPVQMQLVYTDVYARRDGRWQLIAWQSTRAPAPAAP